MSEKIDFLVIGFEHKFAILYNQQFNFQIKWPIKLLSDDIDLNKVISLGTNNVNSNEQTDIKKLLEELIN